jgi:hypothetical protein
LVESASYDERNTYQIQKDRSMADKFRRNFLSTLSELLGGGLAANKVNASAQLSPNPILIEVSMFRKLLIVFAIVFTSLVSAATSYEIEVSHNDELFVINGEKFEAKTYCFNMEEGDRVIFIEGSPYGACTSAVLLNTRTRNTCNVWCE